MHKKNFVLFSLCDDEGWCLLPNDGNIKFPCSGAFACCDLSGNVVPQKINFLLMAFHSLKISGIYSLWLLGMHVIHEPCFSHSISTQKFLYSEGNSLFCTSVLNFFI